MQVESYWWFGTVAAVVALLALDLLVTGRQKRPPTPAQAGRWVGFYVAAAVLFGVLVLVDHGARYGGEFFAGWLTEYSLSVDNLFVFMVLMARFAVPAALQLRVLTVGVVLALLLRAGLIGVGAAAIERFSWVFYVFGAFLVWTAWTLLRGEDDAQPRVEENRVVRGLGRVLPTTRTWHGGRLVAREGGRRRVTPMLVTMVAIGTTDVLFALDSIPAIFGLTREPFLVVAANAFALMGLRQLYFLVGGLLQRLVYLSKGLSLVLAFIGVKLVLEALHDNALPFVNGGRPLEAVPLIPTWMSLAVVAGTLAATAALSLLVSRRRARAGQRDRERALVA